MDGQAGFRHHSASSPGLGNCRAATDACCSLNTLASVSPAKTFDAFHRTALNLPGQEELHESSAGQRGRTRPRESRHDGAQDAFMQLFKEHFGGDAFHFQSSIQSSYCSSNKHIPALRGAGLSYTSETSSSSATFQPPHSSGHGEPGFWLPSMCMRTPDHYLRTRSGVAEQPLSLTLEEIYHGGMKQVECMRTIVDGVSGYNMPVTELVPVRITPGIREGTRVVLKERGDEHLGARSSDVALVVREELHPRFERKGDDLLTRVEVPLVQALTSSYVQVPLLDGDTMEVAVRGPLNPDSEIVLPGMGMPTPEDSAQAGDLHVRFKISFPERVTSAQKAQLQAALPEM